MINADGTGLRQLTKNAASDIEPAFSPDGKKIAFISSRDGGDNDIFKMRADGSRQAPLTANDDVNDRSPSWQPDP